MVGHRRRRHARRWRALRLGLVLVLLVLALAPAAVGRADSHTVINADTVAELIGAITMANTNPGLHEIVLAENGDYELTAVNSSTDGFTGLPSIEGQVLITGNGATIRRSSADGTPAFRIFRVAQASQLYLEHVTISNGLVGFGGGAIVNAGTLTLTHSTVSGNNAGFFGGGIDNDGGTATLTYSTVSGNNAGFVGGGIDNNNGTLMLTNSTLSNNKAGNLGGGMENTGTVTLTHSTVSGNDANLGGGIFNDGTLYLTSSLVAHNSAGFAGFDVSGSVAAGSSYNLISNAGEVSGLTHGEDGNLFFGGPLFELDDEGKPYLKDNGGSTKTIALLEGSPAIDHIPVGTNGCGDPDADLPILTDQRVVVERPQGEGCDIGAFELEVDDEDDPEVACTVKMGYWKDNPEAVEALLPLWLGTADGAKSVQVTTAGQAQEIFNRNGDAKNGINRLSSQLLTAKLNLATGTDDTAIAETIDAVDAFLAERDASDWNTLSKQDKQQVQHWHTAREQYNSGVIGPGACP